ncbi:prepilin-type N-terminal cleavage/methylation domain-containing protein [uncultured Clostridium sp.]|uniref:type II secretion system protein n=1 Tax=uncultured Clostridium sp. TaxID=59620 RepID=UPI00262660F4|nr:prepilin-type N-terminal cleavage/methylation domain-containing protein [uncultured Clostridium sp.]
MKRKKKGFTLIEVMAGLVAFAILTTVISSMILMVNKYNGENKNQFDSSSMSRAFNEGIKSIRPLNSSYPVDWKENGDLKYYYISFNSIDELSKAIKEKLLKDNSRTEMIDGYYFKTGVTEEDKIEELSKESEDMGHKYGMKIRVQNKGREKNIFLIQKL